jgi:hypothetical protein
MPPLHHTFGQTTIAKINNPKELKKILVSPNLQSDTIIIKPNWVTDEPADYTEADTLRIIFEALDSKIIVTESHSARIHGEDINFQIDGKKVNWRWLLDGDGWRWLTENPGWDWFKEKHWAKLKSEDKKFQDEKGFTDLFSEFNVDYVNVTDEVWSGRTLDPSEIKKHVESRFQPVDNEEMYSMIPEKLYDHQGSTFISLSKLKVYASFTIKNMFGMIPDPVRPWWHGKNNIKLSTSIIDINKIYHSLYKMHGICEALITSAKPNPSGKHQGLYSGRYTLLDGGGFISFSDNLVELDSLLLYLTRESRTQNTKVNIKPVEDAETVFGSFNKELLTEVKEKVLHWIPT